MIKGKEKDNKEKLEKEEAFKDTQRTRERKWNKIKRNDKGKEKDDKEKYGK